MDAAERIILALDFPDLEQAKRCLSRFPELTWVKVGMELFYREGPKVVQELKSLGYKVFVDLKLHDIPNTVYGGTKSLLNLGADMLNYHISGGKAMLGAAVRAASEHSGPKPFLLGVTQLTSTNQAILESEIGMTRPLPEVVLAYAELARDAGLDGVVCSALETPQIKRQVGTDFLAVTPGIRLSSSDLQDQKRVVTPGRALENGSDYLVIGRSITGAAQPEAAWQEIIAELS